MMSCVVCSADSISVMLLLVIISYWRNWSSRLEAREMRGRSGYWLHSLKTGWVLELVWFGFEPCFPSLLCVCLGQLAEYPETPESTCMNFLKVVVKNKSGHIKYLVHVKNSTGGWYSSFPFLFIPPFPLVFIGTSWVPMVLHSPKSEWLILVE